MKSFNLLVCFRSLLSFLFILMVSASFAQAPKTLSYQGKLSDAGGPLNGSYNLTFTIYDAASGGTSLWTETSNGVAVTGGNVSLTLGKITPIVVQTDKPMWMGIAINTNPEISPRVELTASLYSLGLALPYVAAATSNSPILDITNVGNGQAAAFSVSNPSNGSFALSATTTGGGVGGFFNIDNATNSSPALASGTNGLGSALNVSVYNFNSSASALEITHFGTGNAINANRPIQASKFIGDGSLLTGITGLQGPAGPQGNMGPAGPAGATGATGPAGTISAPFNLVSSYAGNVFRVEATAGGARAGEFVSSSAAGGQAALFATSTGANLAFQALNSGSNESSALFFMQNAASFAPNVKMFSGALGKGLDISLTNPANNSAALAITHSGTGNAITANRPIQATQFIGESIKITNGTEGAGKVLTSDATGLASWQAPVSGGWGLSGTAGAIDGTNFIGTTDGSPLNFRVNNQKAGRIDFVNAFFGYQSGNSNTGGLNSAVGNESLYSNTTGSVNTAIGRQSLYSNTTGSDNTALGVYSLFTNVAGSGATAVGRNAMYFANNSSTAFLNYNVAVGYQALRGSPTPSANTGNLNTAIGSESLYNNTGGGNNTAIGFRSLYNNTTGIFNIAVGQQALDANVTGSQNTALGFAAGVASGALTNATAIGFSASVNTSNTIQLGNGAVTQIFAGMGTNATLIAGGLKITGGTPAVGKVLTSDAAGVATWQAAGGGGWGLTGTSGTIDGTNFIGTIDNVALNFRVFNQRAGRIDNVLNNVFLGYLAGGSAITGEGNVALGNGALQNTTSGRYNVASGWQALQANTTGSLNVATGWQALLSNSSGAENTAGGTYALRSNTTGDSNVAFGTYSLYSNTTGLNNVAIGNSALLRNTTGVANTATGQGALNSNTTGQFNVAVGATSLSSNTIGSGNVANGNNSLQNNTTGGSNVAVGNQALMLNIDGSANTGIGNTAMRSNTAGSNNVALGNNALFSNTTGNNNTSLGSNAFSIGASISNSTAIGFNAQVNASNMIRLGDTNVTVIQGQVGFTAASDQRYKKDIQSLSEGLDFILKLKPVSYKMKNDYDRKTNWGFIAQDIEKLVGTKNAILTIGGDADRTLGLRYTDFVAPLVKAVQEQQNVIEELKLQNSQKDQKVQQMEASIGELKATVSELCSLKAELEKIKNALGMEATNTNKKVNSNNK